MGYPGAVKYVHKIYQTAADVPKKVKKHAASASFFLKMTNTPRKTNDFQFVWYPGVVQYVNKIYQTVADVPKQKQNTCSERLVFSKSDKHSNENLGFSGFL